MEQAFSEAILNLDAAMDVFDRNDHEQINQTKKDAVMKESNATEFTKRFRERAATVHAKEGPPAHKKVKGAVVSRPSLPSADSAFTMTHGEAKAFLPAGATIWRGHGRSVWYGHMMPYSRCSEPFSRAGGEMQAFRCILKKLWSQWLILNGKSAADS